MVTNNILERKGARKVQDIPKNVLHLLNKGEIATVNLTEWLAIDQTELIEHTFPQLDLGELVVWLTTEIRQQKKPSTMASIKLIGRQLYEHCSENESLDIIFQNLANHKSDTIRCYSTYLISLNERLPITEKLHRSIKLVADEHFGVREIVWMALRPEIENNLSESLAVLSEWTKSTDENIRRFTSEVTRPRGVWCKHLDSLKEKPEQALPILAPLKSDSSKYVQASVGNWLNDASKSKPEFVIHLCKKWKIESPTKETEKIIIKARRTIDKK